MLSRMTGTLRYMAPEVALGRPYNTKCDVYSYSLVLWQMLTLQRRPYCHYNDYSHFDSSRVLHQNVHVESERPPLVVGGAKNKDEALSRRPNSFVLGRQMSLRSSTMKRGASMSMSVSMHSNSSTATSHRSGSFIVGKNGSKYPKWIISKGCKQILQGSWTANVQQRWNMHTVNDKLKVELAAISGGSGQKGLRED